MTTDERLQMLEREFARAKNRNRLLIGVLLLFGGVALVGGATRPAKEVRANKFVLVDENGKTRATLGMDKDAPLLAMLDENSKERVVFRHYNLRMAGARATDAFLEMSPHRLLFRVDDEDATRHASLGTGMGEPSLSLRSRNGGCAWLYVEAENGPNLSLFRGHPAFHTFDRLLRGAIGTEDESKRMQDFVGALIEASLAEDFDKSTVVLRLGKDSSGLSIVDKNGNPRAALLVAEVGPGLALFDEDSKPRVTLSVAEQSPRLHLYDENATARFDVHVDKNGPRLRLSDENEKIRVALAAAEHGPALVLRDEDEKGGVLLAATKHGPRLTLLGENHKPRVMLSADEDDSALSLYDENATERFGVTVGKNGPYLQLRDENKKGRVALGASQTETPDGKTITFPESSLLLFGPDGRIRWSAP